MSSRAIACVASVALIALAAARADARPILTQEGVLPPGTDLNAEQLDQPTELFYSELAGGKRSYLLNLGDLLFSSPRILGGLARQAGMSCGTCHQQGHNNPKLFIPGLSAEPGTFDTSNAVFNARADNGVLDPVRIPSLRGAKYLAPYTHDGRFPSLREFIRNAIVNEFAGPEPSAQVLDALEAYVKEIAFLPNSKLGPGGRLTKEASAAARRGEAVFNRPFPHDAALSCASCHRPDASFIDHQLHDVGTGGWIKTPTLVNANFNAPYFHDGRFDSYSGVVDYFDRYFALDFSTQDRADLIAYLQAVGDGEQPVTRNSVEAELDEIAQFVSVLDTALAERNKEVIALTVDQVANEWRELAEAFPGGSDTSIRGGLAERRRASGAAKEMVLTLRRIAMATSADDFAGARAAYTDYHAQLAAVSAKLKVAEAWSLFNPAVREAHFAALNQLVKLAK